jgi:aryl-alcohol dehydrogenase-like predicted oxidoreductase
VDYVNFGNTGLRVSRLCLGMMSFGKAEERPWALGEEEARGIIRQAIEGGITFFDTADVYNEGESEVLTGRILRDELSREEYVLATKVFAQTMPGENGRGLGRKHVLASIDASLQRLGHDYVDLYQIHRWDDTTPIEETMEVLHEVVRSGKARYIGASSMYAWQFAKAQAVATQHGWTRFVSMQNHYNLIYRGRLAGNRGRDAKPLTIRAETDQYAAALYTNPDVDQPVIDRVAEIAGERGVPPAQVALAWLFHKPGVTTPIVGATKPGHIEDAVTAEQLALSDDEIARLEEPYVAHAISGH